MLVTRTSIFTGIKRTMEINIEEHVLQRWSIGSDLIQNLAPYLSEDEREFIMTGVTKEEWDSNFEGELDE